MNLRPNDIVKVRGELVSVMSVSQDTVLFRYFDGGCDAARITDVIHFSTPTKFGAKFQKWASFDVAFYLDPEAGDQVDAITLAERGYEIPKTPSFDLWQARVSSRRTCAHCSKTLRGTHSDWDRHAPVHKLRVV